MNEPVIGAVYVHYKNQRYRVLGLCRHSETEEWLVLYETLYDCPGGKLWVRPKDMFLGHVLIDGKEMRRFRLESSSENA